MITADRKYCDSRPDSSQMGGNAGHPVWVRELEKLADFFMQQGTRNKVKEEKKSLKYSRYKLRYVYLF